MPRPNFITKNPFQKSSKNLESENFYPDLESNFNSKKDYELAVLEVNDSNNNNNNNNDNNSVVTEENNEEVYLKRNFKKRHVDMMAIGGAIGTGLIIGIGTSLKRGGPASLFISFCFTGSILIVVLLSLSEMAAFAPLDKSFSGYATTYVDPAYGFATGWNYFLKYAIALAAELSALGLVIQYWRPDLTVLVICYITALVITCGGGPDHKSIGFKYWKEYAFCEYLVPGSTGKFLGFWSCCIQSCFAYIGSESIGVFFGESPNPRKTIPLAAKRVLFRICGFYILGSFMVGLIISPKDAHLATAKTSNTSGSPFVIAFSNASIKGLPSFINAMLLVFIGSSANAIIYICSRTMFGLAKDGQAPKLFLKLNPYHVPYYGCIVAALIGLISFMEVGSTSAANVFGYLTSSVTVFGILNWTSILVSYINYRKGIKYHKIPNEAIHFQMWYQPYAAYVALFFVAVITFFFGYNAFIEGFHYKIFLTSYIGIIVYIGNILFWKLFKKTKRVKIEDMAEFYQKNAERNLSL